jgi:recombination protein RecA
MVFDTGYFLSMSKNSLQPIIEQTKQNQAIEQALSQIRKLFGKESIFKLGDASSSKEVDVVSTGSLALDLALGIQGLPYGRICEIYGPESSGKTTLTLHVIAEAQKQGKICAFIDTEHALDPAYARALHVKTEDLLISQPENAEQALDITDTLVRSNAVNIIIVDSVAALVPKAELEGDMGDSHMGLHARLMSQALRKLTGSISRSNCLLIFINQIRQKIGVFFGNPETTTGGNALKFYASIRLDIRRTGAIKGPKAVGASSKEKEPDIGNITRVKIVKNKLSAPFRTADFEILYGKGICRSGELMDLGELVGSIQKSGTWFSYQGEKLGQGRENSKHYLSTHPEIAKKLECEIRERYSSVQEKLIVKIHEERGEDDLEGAAAA